MSLVLINVQETYHIKRILYVCTTEDIGFLYNIQVGGIYFPLNEGIVSKGKGP